MKITIGNRNYNGINSQGIFEIDNIRRKVVGNNISDREIPKNAIFFKAQMFETDGKIFFLHIFKIGKIIRILRIYKTHKYSK